MAKTKLAKHNKFKTYGLALGSFIIAFILGTTMIAPVFDRRFDVFNIYSSPNEIQAVGDNDSAAYDYWYPPSNSFGMSEWKSLNWTYWKHWLKDTFDWGLRASGNGNPGTWQDASSLLSVGLNFNDANSTAKITLTLDTHAAPKALYYQFYIICNRTVLQYMNYSDKWDWQLTLPANATENYTIDFNWSDIKPLVDNGKVTIGHGVKDDLFYFTVTSTYAIPKNTVFVIDPTFGDTSTYISDMKLATWKAAAKSEDIYSEYASPEYSGYVTKITAYVKYVNTADGITASLYDSSSNRLSTGSAEVTPSSGYVWRDFTFASPVSVTAGQNYYIVLYGDAPNSDPGTTVSYGAVSGRAIGGNGGYTQVRVNNYPTFPNPASFTLMSTSSYSIYAVYNAAPTFATPLPANASTGRPLTPKTNITINDLDGNAMTLTWFYNTSGAPTTWTNYGHNTSVANGTYRQSETFASAGNTKYFWKVYCNDGTNNVSAIYHFTTVASTPSNTAPTITANSQNPKNQSTAVSLSLVGNYSHFNITVADANDATQNMNITWKTNETTGSWHTFDTNASVNNGTYYSDNVSWVDEYSKKYWWAVTVNDGCGGWANATYYFTTKAGTWHTVNTWNGTLWNQSSFNQIQDFNGTIFNTSAWSIIQEINGTLFNQSNWFLSQDFNGTIFDTSTYTQVSLWNGSVYNISGFNQIESWNGTLYNTTEWLIVNDYNGTIYNTTGWLQVNLWNGTIYNTTAFKQIELWNGSIYNTSEYTQISLWNGTIFNTSAFSQISLWNGTIFNVTNYLLIQEWNGSVFNSSNWNQISLWNGTIFNASGFHQINNFNGTIYNATIKSWQQMSDWNGTLFNVSGYSQVNLWNGSIYNTSAFETIDDWNGTIYNQSNFNLIQLWNGSIFNTSNYKTISLWNGSLFNQSNYHLIQESNGTIYNVSIGFVLINEWNGSLYNQSSWNQISLWNGTIYNTSNFIIINLWNGSIFNETNWIQISLFNGTVYNESAWYQVNQWNGTLFNTSQWNIIDEYNGTIYNTSGFKQIALWNGSIFNTSTYIQINLWNGTLYNQSGYHLINEYNGSIFNVSLGFALVNEWNGSLYNQSLWNQVDLWNGTVYNASNYYLIQDWNGTLYNQSQYYLINQWNGSLYNISIGFVLVNDWNGSIYNQSSWHGLEWNGTIFNTSAYTQVNLWNGSLYNQSNWHQIDLWNGTIYNVSIGFITVQEWNGSILNQSTWNLIEEWHGSIYNQTTYNLIQNWNGTIFNQSQSNPISTWNGSIYNTSSFNAINDWNGTIFNSSSFNLVNQWNGSIYNQSSYNQVEQWNGTIYNISIGFILVQNWNGTIYNQSSWNLIINWNGTVFNTSAFEIINNWNGTVYNQSQAQTINTWNGTIFNISGMIQIQDWNGSIYNASIFNQIILWNGSIFNTTFYVQINLWNGSIYNASLPYNLSTPYNLNLLVINPNPGNGTHNTNYLKSNASGLTTSIDIYYENFTTPSALIPGSYSSNITGITPANAPTIWNTSATYNDAWANTTGTITPGNIYVGQYILLGDYTIMRSYLMFDTSAIPDLATITSGYVQLVVMDDQSTDDFNVTLQQVKSPKPHNPLIGTDYGKAGIAGHLGHTNTTGYADESIFRISLTVSGLADVNKSGTTKWSLRSNKDINASSPADYEFMIFYGYGVATAKYPRIILNYTVPGNYWQNIVNLTWLSNSSGAWVQYNKSYINHNGTITVHAINFSGIDSYFWHLEWESNKTNNGSSQIFTFTTVAGGSGSGASMNGENRFAVGLISGFAILLMIGVALLKHMKKKRNGRKT